MNPTTLPPETDNPSPSSGSGRLRLQTPPKESPQVLPTPHSPLPTKIAILAAGEFPTHEVPLRALREADFLVCCDSAYLQLTNAFPHSHINALPYVVIGDGDSLTDETKRALGDRWIHVPEQDYNDLHKAMHWATSHYPLSTTHYTLIGATGRREDHTLGNISYLATFAEEYPGIHLEMLTNYGRFTLVSPSSLLTTNYQLPTFKNQQISIFPVDPSVPFSATGLRWPIDNMKARFWWQATLNEALSDTFTLTSASPLILFQTYDAK